MVKLTTWEKVKTDRGGNGKNVKADRAGNWCEWENGKTDKLATMVISVKL